MTEEEQRQEVAVWGENMNLMKDCSLEKTDEDMYYNSEWDYTCEEFMLKDIGIGFRTIEGATEVANLLIKYNAFKMESKFLIGSYEQFWIINGSVCPAITGEAGYSKEEFDKVNKENKDPELESINSFNDTVKKANEIKDRVLKYVYNIKQERSYNNDLVGIFERYKDIADGDMEVAMNFIKEAYPFNEETESFIRKKFDMPMPNESKEQ